MRARLAAVLALCALALPLAAEEPPAEPERHPQPATEDGWRGRILGGAWCTVTEGRPAEPDPDAEEEEPEEERIGCDAGPGAELVGKSYRQGRISAVAVAGTKSVGVGVSWSWVEWGRPVAVAAGVVAPWDSDGVYVGEWALAVGATVGLFGGRGAGP